MTSVMGHCDDIDHLGIVMKGIVSTVMTGGMKHCDENSPGLL